MVRHDILPDQPIYLSGIVNRLLDRPACDIDRDAFPDPNIRGRIHEGVKFHSDFDPIRIGDQRALDLVSMALPFLGQDDLNGRRLVSVLDRKSTRLNSSHIQKSRMPSSA